MDVAKKIYTTFPFEWTIKSISCLIKYRKAFNTNEIDEIFCSIINAKGNEICFSELAILLGFNLQDLAEIDILNTYLKSLTEYKLIEKNNEIIKLTTFGKEALHSKLKFKYYFATTELFENLTAKGESFDFSFKRVFDLENKLFINQEFKDETLENPVLKQKLQYQLFENDIYKGEIVELFKSNLRIYYKSFFLQCDVSNSFQLLIYKLETNKPEIQFLIDLPENENLKNKLIRKGKFHHILSEKISISKQDIETYIDLWNWKELAENPKLDWIDKGIFQLFIKYGDGSIWNIISKKAPIESIKFVIKDYSDYWDWTTLTERFDNDFIKQEIETYNWDFKELSYKETELVTTLLKNLKLKDRDWDWSYLSENLPDTFIEKYIDVFNWDFYLITKIKSGILRNLFSKGSKHNSEYAKILLSKSWNWEFITNEFDVKFLYDEISLLAKRVDWHEVLNRFFNNKEIVEKCLKDVTFKTILKEHLPENYVVAHQKYLWTIDLIDFFEGQKLIQWKSYNYMNGFDTNENVNWDKSIFQKYHNLITTESGFLNVSRKISDYNMIIKFPNFSWNWDAISQNINFVKDPLFIEKAFTFKFNFSINLNWSIIIKSIINIDFINKHLSEFYNKTLEKDNAAFWNELTKKENDQFIFNYLQIPWDWTLITERIDKIFIINNFNNKELVEKWDWKYLITEFFTIENEHKMDNLLPRIANCLTVLTAEKRREIWKAITVKFRFEILFPLIKNTIQLDVYEWDWNYISNHNHFPTDIRTINQFRTKINWTIFSESTSIQNKFNPGNWGNSQECYNNICYYLQEFENNWDWQILSRNKNINFNRLILMKYKDKNWDWDYLTEFGGFLIEHKSDKSNKNYLNEIIKQFPQINFEYLSRRIDIKIDSSLIRSTKDKNWNWQVLSENEKVEISNKLILELKDKNWNWQALSKKKNIEFNNETLLQLIDKGWNWNDLSENQHLIFNAKFINKTKTKSWNWKAVSKHKSFLPTVDILTLTKHFDLDWKSITQKAEKNFKNINFIKLFADKWDWHFICKSEKLIINNKILNEFKEHLDWNLISSNSNIQFTKEIIQAFKQYWNWSRLKVNKRVEELLGNYVADEINKDAILNFIDKIEQQNSEWKGNIYHFTHIDNAVEIIKKLKIQSRKGAKKMADVAGNVVHRREDAHNYARFYFRPHTPTQFYNEFLGKNTSDGYNNYNNDWVSWYEKARSLGFPKCPVPIFFKFSLKEVLFKHKKKCCVSNGNMQADSSKFNSIEQMLDKFNFDYLYSNMEFDREHNKQYLNYSQQEFLVKDELSFEDLFDFKIVCPFESDRILLIKLLGPVNPNIFSKIIVDISYYNNENPRVRIEEVDSELHISSNFNGEGYFVLKGVSDLKDIGIQVGDVTKTTNDKIIFKSNISLSNVKQNLVLNFIDESNRNWFVYKK